MNNFHSDRAQKQTLNAPEASRSHHNVIDAFVTSYLGDSFRHETSFDEGAKANATVFAFFFRLFEAPADAREAVSCQSPLAALVASEALMVCTLSRTREAPGL